MVTRFINDTRIANIYHSDGGQGRVKKQVLVTFHDELRQLGFTRIDDLVIGHFFAPNSVMLNRLFCQATNLNQILLHNRTDIRLNDRDALLAEHFVRILGVMPDASAAIKQCLQEIRLYQYGINRCELDDLVVTHGELDDVPVERDAIIRQSYKMELSAQKEMKLRNRITRIDIFTRSIHAHIQQMNMLTVVDYANIYKEVQTCFGEVMDELLRYKESIHERSQREVENYEYVEMQNMYRQLKFLADDRPKYIDQCTKRLELLHDIKVNRMDNSRRVTNEKFENIRNRLNEGSHKNMENVNVRSKELKELVQTWNESKLAA